METFIKYKLKQRELQIRNASPIYSKLKNITQICKTSLSSTYSMMRLHLFIRNAILRSVDFFYPPFKKIFSLQIFRYLVCGGGNTLLSIVWYYIGYNYVFSKHNVDLYFVTISPYIAAEYLFAIWINYPMGFYLSRYVVFQESSVKTGVQALRYVLIMAGMILLNYILLKLFIEVFHWYPTLSKGITTIFIILYSYLLQRFFAFRSITATSG